jgi:hypothetical protein
MNNVVTGTAVRLLPEGCGAHPPLTSSTLRLRAIGTRRFLRRRSQQSGNAVEQSPPQLMAQKSRRNEMRLYRLPQNGLITLSPGNGDDATQRL